MASSVIDVKGTTFSSTSDVLMALQQGKIAMDVAQQLIERFSTKGDKPQGAGQLYFKVSEKGAVSVYGLQRMPVTLYGEQWKRLLDPAVVEKLQAFLTEKDALLAKKGDKPVAAAAAGK